MDDRPIRVTSALSGAVCSLRCQGVPAPDDLPVRVSGGAAHTPVQSRRQRRDLRAEPDLTGIAPPDCAWSAIDANTYDGAPDSANRHQIGFGRTREEAIADLMEKLGEAP